MKLKSSYIKLRKDQRLYGLDIPIIALTGGIATGKSSVSKLFIQRGLPLLDADKLVKIVYQKDVVESYLRDHFPQVLIEDLIDFRKLRELFFSDDQTKVAIEKLIYSHLPEVFNEELKKLGRPSFVIYDIPLLFEKNLEEKFDLNLLVYTTPEIQIERLMKRDNHSQAEALNIIHHQLSIEEKKKRADLIISNTQDFLFLESQVNEMIDQLLE